jgi:HNH endonuclease
MKRKPKRRGPDPFAIFWFWVFRQLWNLILWIWRKWFPTVPKVPPGEKPSEAVLKLFYSSPEWKRLAWRTKQKRGWRCENPQCRAWHTPDNPVVTDHVKSVRNHWELRLDAKNLQILCNECNLGKGSWNYIDFRPVRTGWLGWLVWFWSGLRWFWLDRNRKCKDV